MPPLMDNSGSPELVGITDPNAIVTAEWTGGSAQVQADPRVIAAYLGGSAVEAA